MDAPVLALVISFLVLLVLNVPIAIAIGIASICALIADQSGGMAPEIMARNLAQGIDSFSLLAIPFFILSGLLMAKGGIASRLIDFADSIVGGFTGGLAYVNVITCMMFGSISGSAVAAVSSVGGFMIPEMNAKGYDRDFNVAVTTTAATTGLMIPPSNIMIVYSLAAGGLSIAELFLAGLVPGIIVGLFLMIVCGIISFKRGYGAAVAEGEEVERGLMKRLHRGSGRVARTFARALLSLLLIVIVLGGILGGIFTPTEAAAIAVLYSFILAVFVYRQVKLNEIPALLLQSGITTAIVMFIIGASRGMSWVMTTQDIPQNVSAALLSFSDNKYAILLMINALLLFVGTFMDITPAVLIFTPIFLPVAKGLGMDPIHFGIMMIANLCIGLCTPPVGTCLFVGCGVGKTSIAKVTPSLIPFFAAMVVALMLITYLPQLSLWLPELVIQGRSMAQ